MAIYNCKDICCLSAYLEEYANNVDVDIGSWLLSPPNNKCGCVPQYESKILSAVVAQWEKEGRPCPGVVPVDQE